jgi:Skp family chaperone for outer membrane proteins
VKRMTWMVAALATFALAGQAHAQGTRVALVNIGTVFNKYDKAKNFKTEMEGVLKPFKEEADKVKKDMLAYNEALKTEKDPQKRDQWEQGLKNSKRRLEDLDAEARRKIGPRQDAHLMQLYKEVSEHIKSVASANGIHVVFGYGEPPDNDLFSPQNVDRKLRMMDMGAMTPLYFHASLDISDYVVQSLNRSYGAVNATPTASQK